VSDRRQQLISTMVYHNYLTNPLKNLQNKGWGGGGGAVRPPLGSAPASNHNSEKARNNVNVLPLHSDKMYNANVLHDDGRNDKGDVFPHDGRAHKTEDDVNGLHDDNDLEQMLHDVEGNRSDNEF
jgi:hypothetical protein